MIGSVGMSYILLIGTTEEEGIRAFNQLVDRTD